MTGSRARRLSHLVGLGLAAALVAAGAAVWVFALPWLDGTWLGDLAPIVFAVAAAGLLQLGEAAWGRLDRLLSGSASHLGEEA